MNKLEPSPAKKSRWLRFGIVTGLLCALGIMGGAAACRTPSVPLPPGITCSTAKLNLTGQPVNVDFYLPSGTNPAPVALVAHGWSRSRKNMAGWGVLLASNGFITAVPDAASQADFRRHSRALGELLAGLQSGKFLPQSKPDGRSVLVGFSLGGLSTLLAAASNTTVCCWVGLDPVDLRGAGTEVAKAMPTAAVVLRAEPGPWNQQGNARQILEALPGPLFALRVRHAVHCDAEHPSNWLGELACGRTVPARRDVFEGYALAALRATVFGQTNALRQLEAATHDPAVDEVLLRGFK